MKFLTDLKNYSRFAVDLKNFLRHPLALEEARAIVARRMNERERNFLRLIERGVFGYPQSPYLPLLKLAGCEMGDIRNMVPSRGLEGTLRALREAGVYITFEEFKGRTPVVRGGKTIEVSPRDFNNPYLTRHYEIQSGGTTGVATRVGIDLDHLADRAPTLMLAHDAHGSLDAPTAIWRGVLPNGSGINSILTYARMKKVPLKWFSPVMNRDLRPSLRFYLTHYAVVGTAVVVGRLLGVRLPWPEPVRLDSAATVARWAAETVKAHGQCFISAPASMALRVCIAAGEEGLDIHGTIFSGGGEPPTPAKIKEITRAGARCFPGYFFAEAGPVGLSCAEPVDTNDQHFMKDSLALIQSPRRAPGTDMTAEAFYLTTLLPAAPKLMLNVELDDYGVIETRSCGCPLGAYGFTEHLRHIGSFQKLTGEGVSLAGSEMIRILDEVLPARFGGTPLDYQLMEEEDEQGFTRLSLLVSPKVEIADETAVIETVLRALGQSSIGADMTRAYWTQSKTLRVKRIDPVWTARGKLMPLHLARRARKTPS